MQIKSKFIDKNGNKGKITWKMRGKRNERREEGRKKRLFFGWNKKESVFLNHFLAIHEDMDDIAIISQE